MGIVHLAVQRALGREVAVKTIKADVRGGEATLKLLREAWITGALEHPNVVPVHDVRLDADGQPQIVLKKIEGAPWSDILAKPAAISERFGASDSMDWNLRVFLQVAGAIHYAHRRGFLHRDLKPENVMIGSFGEVYVVDWGLSVALNDDGTGRFPLATDAHELAGTPAYMAPEMLGGEAVVLDERTDVYLLGAVLFEIATGNPPRDGTNLLHVLGRILEPVEVPETVSDELGRILSRALSLRPGDRYPSAEALQKEVQAFLAHRGSIQLATEAHARLEELSALPADERERIDALFAECRFGFQQALRAWPENPLARRGLSLAITRRIELELGRGNAAVASHLLGELPGAPPELRAAVERARQKELEEHARQAAFERDHDPSIGRRTRAFVGSMMALSWVVGPALLWVLRDQHPRVAEYPGAISGTLFLMGLGAAFGVWARDSLGKTWINRALVKTVAITLSSQLALLFGGYLGDVPFSQTQTTLVLTWSLGTALTANAIDPRLYLAAAGYLVGFAVLVVQPELRFVVTVVTNVVLLVSVSAMWFSPKDDFEEFHERRAQRRASRS